MGNDVLVPAKKAYLNGQKIFDITDTTAVASDVAQGKYFYDANGDKVEGTATSGGGGSSELFEDLVDRTISSVSTSDLANINRIGENAFSNCRNLRNIEIPSNIEDIYPSAFWNCQNLQTVRINEGCTSIGGRAFANCTSLTTIYIPSTVYYIQQDGVFDSCSRLTDIYFNGTVSAWTQLDEYDSLFESYLSQTITVHCADGDKVYNQSVGNMIITYNDNSTDTIPVQATVYELSNYTLSGSTDDIVRIDIPNGVQTISNYAFMNLGYVIPITVYLPSSVGYIGESAFDGGFDAVYLAATLVPTISYDTFALYSGSYTIYVPTSALTDYQNDSDWSQYTSRLQGYNFS